MREFTNEQLDIMFAVDLPILKYYDLSQYTREQLIDLSIPAYTEFLIAALENKLEDYLHTALKRWETNQLPNITRDQLVVEDVTLAAHVRQKALISFIPQFTNDVTKALDLVKEIDEYSLMTLSYSFNTYVKIHEEKVNEINNTLVKHEEELLQAQEIASFGSFEWDLVNNNSKYTPQVFKIFEMTKAGNLQEFMEFVHPGDRQKLQNSINNALKGEGDYECEYRYRRNGKEKVLWSKGIVTFVDNKPSVMKGTVMDITDRHYILKRLERNEELYKQAQKLTHIGNWTWDIETNQVSFSDELYNIYGISQNEKIDLERFLSFVHPEDKEIVSLELVKTLKTLNPHTIDFRIIRTDGTIRAIHRNAEALIDEKGKPYKLAGTGQDVTTEKKIKSELEQKKNELAELNISLEEKNTALERSNKELTSFSYVASHDLQEPLRKIKTFSNLILEKEHNLSPEGKDCFERIIVSAGRMQKLIEDLLSFSRTQQYENILAPIDLNLVLEEIKTFYAEPINQGQIQISNDKLPIVEGVHFQMQQLFENIISNSVKYSKPQTKTEITISSSVITASKEPFLNLKENKKFYKISISDNGIGFDQKYSEKIFEIFKRLHGKDEFTGTGIGLSICKKIVENHSGFITANGVLNQGSTFIVYLPVN